MFAQMVIKLANERYMFHVNQELELMTHELEEAVRTNFDLDIEEYGLKYIFALNKTSYLYFPFGKYKGRIVQDVLVEDKEYCKWFLQNVFGRNENELKILDYLNKAINYNNKNYMFLSLISGLSLVYCNFIQQNEKVRKNWEHHKQMIIEDYNYQYNQNIKGNASVDKDLDLSCPEDDPMTDVYNYEDFC